MGKRLFKEMNFRGSITEVKDFSKLEDRKDGMIYKLELSENIADPNAGEDVSPTAGTGDFDTVVNHADPDHADFCKIDGSSGVASTFITDGITVGSKIIVNGIEKFVVSIASETELVVNTPFVEPLIAATFEFIPASDVATTAVHVEPTHADKIHAHYAELTGTGTSFTLELKVGDIVEIAGQKRAVKSITSDTILHLDSKIPVASGVDIFKIEDKLTTVQLVGTIATHAEHDTYANADYCVVTASVGDFSTINPGDKIVIFKDRTGYERTVMSKAGSNIVLDIPISGSLESIDSAGEAVGFFKSVTGHLFTAGTDASFQMWFDGAWVPMTGTC